MAPVTNWLLHAAAVWFMTGLIWLIQCVHYPLFLRVGRAEFEDFHRLHSRWITWIVGPVMLLELFTAGALFVPGLGPDWIPLTHRASCLLLSLAVFAFTALFSVPAHGRLAANGRDEGTIRFLIASNWLRTVAWSAHAALATGLTLEAWPQAPI
jgi:hypothetical protein